jgi:hypothetical protein
MAISNQERVGKAMELLRAGRAQSSPQIARLAREGAKPKTEQAMLFEETEE